MRIQSKYYIEADSLKIANAIRPAIESRLDQLRDDKAGI